MWSNKQKPRMQRASMRLRLSSSMSEEMIAEVLSPLKKAACIRLTPRTPTASCCSCADLSNMRMCTTIEFGSNLQQSPRLVQQNTLHIRFAHP